jgi:hypothetical protein
MVFKYEVLEKVGLPDEVFQGSSFESDDYCLRVRRAGFRIWIARDCYIHSVRQDDAEISQEKKSQFEEKWSTQWKDPGSKMLESALQDGLFLIDNGKTDTWAQELVSAAGRDFERKYNLLIDEISSLEEKNRYLEARLCDELSFSENLRQIKRKIGRRLFRITQNNSTGLLSDTQKEINNIQNKIDGLLNKAHTVGNETVSVFAPMFTPENIGDGYLQRVKAIDEEILNDYVKVYIELQEPEQPPDIKAIGEKHIFVKLDPKDLRQTKVIRQTIQKTGMIYIHSVLRIMKNTIPDSLRDEIFIKGKKKIIWDVHGSVPEEFEMQSDFYKAQIADEAEAFLAKNADISIVVSNAMKRHLEKKYSNRLNANVIVMPIFNAEQLKPTDCKKEKILNNGQLPLVVYAGGLQKWQKIDEMQDIIAEAGHMCRYVIFCPRPEEFFNKWGIRTRPQAMNVEYKTPEEIKEVYKRCHYGFSLRDNVTVNNVACPTKIIEYIQYGIVPILDTPMIGDFNDLGLEYISGKSFAKGDFPEENERQLMAEKNYAILEKLKNMYLEGKKNILQGASNA